MSAFLKEIPALVWVAALFGIAWVRMEFRARTRAKEPGGEIPAPPPKRQVTLRFRL